MQRHLRMVAVSGIKAALSGQLFHPPEQKENL